MSVWEGRVEAIQYHFIHVRSHNIHFIQFIHNYNNGTVTTTMQPYPSLLVDKPLVSILYSQVITVTNVGVHTAHSPPCRVTTTHGQALGDSRKEKTPLNRKKAAAEPGSADPALTVCFIRNDRAQLIVLLAPLQTVTTRNLSPSQRS